jgi:peptidylprolyl isomerase
VSFALLLAACGGGSSGKTETKGGDGGSSGALAKVEVSGKAGEKPTVTFDKPFTTATTVRRVVDKGDGQTLKAGDKVEIDYLGINGRDGKEFDTSYGKSPATLTLDPKQVIPGFAKGLTGATVGSRVLIAVAPDDGYGPRGGVSEAGIKATDTLLFVVDVKGVKQVLTRATGDKVEPKPGLPTVELAADGKPTITIPDAAPPAELVVQPLIIGKGAKVQAGQTLTAHYTGVIWPGGKQFDSSWDRGAPSDFQIGAGRVIKGWDEGLVGQTVGSQVLLVIPPDKGYGPEGNSNAGIKGTDTLVFVVDILGAS